MQVRSRARSEAAERKWESFDPYEWSWRGPKSTSYHRPAPKAFIFFLPGQYGRTVWEISLGINQHWRRSRHVPGKRYPIQHLCRRFRNAKRQRPFLWKEYESTTVFELPQLHLLCESVVLSRDKGPWARQRLEWWTMHLRGAWKRMFGKMEHSWYINCVYALFVVLSCLQRVLIYFHLAWNRWCFLSVFTLFFHFSFIREPQLHNMWHALI